MPKVFHYSEVSEYCNSNHLLDPLGETITRFLQITPICLEAAS